MEQTFLNISKDRPDEQFGHFTGKELYSRSLDAPKEHELSEQTVNAWNIVRDYYNKPLKINSTYRTKLHELSLKKGFIGEHYYKRAIDGAFLTSVDQETLLPDFIAQILTQGTLFKKLRNAGINGFGVYDTFVHLDSRPQNGLAHRDEFGTFAFWDNRTKIDGVQKPFFKSLWDGYGKEDGDLGVPKNDSRIVTLFLIGSFVAAFFFN